MNTFPCTQCGQCCRMVGKLLLLKNATSPGKPYYIEMRDFPYKSDVNGVCEKLTAGGQCGVYDNRPDLCNIETIRQRYFGHLTTAEYYRLTAGHCNNMMDVGDVAVDFRIPIV